jgi:SAM-dependent methyltransferase
MQDKIAIILPVRNGGAERYKRITRCLDSYRQVTQGLSDIYLLHDKDECHIYDPIMEKYPEVINYCMPTGLTLVEKINVHALDIASKYKYIGFIGDDIVFRTLWEGQFVSWLSKQKYALAFANDLVHTTGGLPTHPFVTSNMVTTLGFFGCPAVGHHYLDNFWMDIARQVGEVKFFSEIIMEHFHPVVGKAPEDQMYHEIESKFEENNLKYREYKKNEFWNDVAKFKKVEKRRSLDLGCGFRPKNPFEAEELFGIDIFNFNTVGFEFKVADLNIEPIPYPDNHFDYVTAYDFLEHIPRLLYIDGKAVNPFIKIMNEIYRVLKPNGVFKAHTPYYPHLEAFTDPTHVNIITEKTVDYFTNGTSEFQLAQIYGFTGNFEKINQYTDPVWTYHLVWELSAVK